MDNSSYDDFFSLEITLPVICAAILLVIGFKLYRLLVYRLALYQVISAKFCFVFLIFLLYKVLPNRLEYSFGLSSISLKVVLTVWIVFHLFALSVFHKNFKRLELLYVVSSMVFAIVIFILMMTTYDEISESRCYNFSNSSFNHTTNGLAAALFCIGIILLVVSSILVGSNFMLQSLQS